MGINILGDKEQPKRIEQVQTTNPIKENSGILSVILIMGVILVAGIWFASSPCPELSCPDITIPACPTVTVPTCQECPDCNPILACNLNETNTTNCTNSIIGVNSVTLFNSTNYNQNRTIQLNQSGNRTTELNMTDLGLGNLIIIGVNYE